MNVSLGYKENSGQRYSWIDYDRGLSIILVSFRHAFESIDHTLPNMADYPMIEYVNVFLFGFRMPLFFIASGLFLSASLQKKGFGKYNTSRAETILYPMLIWGCIQLSLQLVFVSYSNADFSTMDYVWLILDPRKTGQFWYLHALFLVGLLYSFMKIKVKLTTKNQLLLGLLLYAGVAVIRYQEYYLGFFMDIMQYYLFFAIGDGISVAIRSEKNKTILASPKLLLMLIPLFAWIQYNFTAINLAAKDNYHVEHHLPHFFLAVALVGCLLSINISFILAKNNTGSYLKVIGFHSVHIYCMQIIFMALTRAILINVFKISSAPVLLIAVLIAGVLIPIYAYRLFMKWNMWWLFSYKKQAEKITAVPG